MIPLLICSFIFVNALSGYLNADPSIASAATLKADLKRSQEQRQALRVSKSLAREARTD
jgi:hypothetical protein